MVQHFAGGDPRSGRNNGNEDWTRVSYRRKTQISTDGARFNCYDSSTVTYFVSNLPEVCSNNFLWRLFERHGKICDSFVSKRRDKSKSFFGFVKFKGVSDPYDFESKLRDVKWKGAILSVNLARFDRHHKPIQYSNAPAAPCHRPHPSSSGANVSDSFHSELKTSKPGFSYKDACVGKSSTGFVPKVINIPDNPPPFPQFCKGRSVLCEALNLNAIDGALSLLHRGGFEHVTVLYVGGLQVLLVFKDNAGADSFMAVKEVLWASSFSKASVWLGEHIPFERLIQLRVWGVPFHLRDPSTYENIGRLFGKLVNSSFSWAAEDTSYGSCLIVSNSGNHIEEELFIAFQGKQFKVWVTEENVSWKPKVFFDDGEVDHRSLATPDIPPESVLKNDVLVNESSRMAVDEAINHMNDSPNPVSSACCNSSTKVVGPNAHHSSNQVGTVQNFPTFHIGLPSKNNSRKRPRCSRSHHSERSAQSHSLNSIATTSTLPNSDSSLINSHPVTTDGSFVFGNTDSVLRPLCTVVDVTTDIPATPAIGVDHQSANPADIPATPAVGAVHQSANRVEGRAEGPAPNFNTSAAMQADSNGMTMFSNETRLTMEVGSMVGFELQGFDTLVQQTVNGEGVLTSHL